MRVLACQITVPPIESRCERDEFIGTVVHKIDRRLAEVPVDLVFLPELCTIDYGIRSFERLVEFAEPLDGSSSRAFGRLAARHNTIVAFGMPRREGKSFFISHVFVGCEGSIIGHYDKLHLVTFGESKEGNYFSPGNHLITLDIAGLRVAPAICYDFRFSGLFHRLAVDLEADVIIHPVAFGRDTTFPSWHSFAIARALEYQIHFLSLNRAGERYGHSIYVPPWIHQKTCPFHLGEGEAFEYFELDRNEIIQSRRSHSLQHDRRSDYAKLRVHPVTSKIVTKSHG